MPDLSKFFAQALLLLQALVAGGVIKSQSGVEITAIVSDLEAVVNAAKNPGPDIANQVASLLAELKNDGVIGGTVVDQLAQAATQFGAFVKDIQSGQVGVIDSHKSLAGVEGCYAFIPYGGAAAQSLGLS